MSSLTTNIAIFASGGGSNAEAIIRYFQNHPHIKIRLIVSNKASAGVLQRATNHGINTLLLRRHDFYDQKNTDRQLKQAGIDLIVLAGFLWLVPAYLIAAFPNKILNIHPALLPQYGGKGMYGHHIHQAVFDHGEKETGMTVHLVNEQYDEGQILLQARCRITAADTPTTIAAKVLKLEHRYYPVVVEQVAMEEVGG